jgi:site-specific recombinase XerD
VQRRWLAKTEAALVPIIKAYTDSLMVQRYSLRTFDAYLNAFVNYAKHIGLDKVAEASNNDVRSYLATLSAQKISDSMLNTYVSALKFYYEKVLRQHKIDTKDIKRPRKGRHLPTILSIEEISRMIEVADNLKHRTIIYTLYSSGMRLNEILSLKIEDMWWDRDQIMVRGGKGKKDRVVPFSNVLKQLLLLYYEEYKPIYWLFEGQDRKHQYTASSMQKVIKSLKTKAKISKKVTAHTIRHCFATHLLEGGTDIRYIQELLGHKDIKTTLIYTHVTNDSIMKIESPLDKLMKNNKKDEKNEK